MFDDSFKAVLTTATIKAIYDDKTLRRILEPKFLLDFTEGFAKGLGDAARDTWDLTADGPLKKSTIDADAFPCAHATFCSGSDQLTVKDVVFGDGAIARPKNPEDFPTMTLPMSFSWTEESLLYFAKRLGEEMTIRLKRARPDLPGTSGKGKAKKKKAARKQTAKQTEMAEKPDSTTPAADPASPSPSVA